MNSVRYIHAADLHLDTPFQGLSRESAAGRPARLLQNATFTALERLFRFCESEKPDFLVLAGDIYNQENHSVKAQLALRDGCVRLDQLGIRVFLAHGNHDPLDSRFAAVEWPANVTIFGPEPERHEVYKNGELLALVHGISHAKAKEGRNLARLFKRHEVRDATHGAAHEEHDKNSACFQLGVLHCTVEGEAKADRYAPCSADDLKNTNLDAWALGHVHERRVISPAPFIAYSGNSQGLHINEPGPRGCLLVTASPHDKGFTCTTQFLRLGPVQWEKLELNLAGVEHIDEVERRLCHLLEEAADSVDPDCEALMTRIILRGASVLDATLRDPATQEDLLERMAYFAQGSPAVCIKDMLAETHAFTERAEYLQREDLLGEAVRLTERLRNDPALLREMGDSALTALFEHGKLRRILESPDAAEVQALLDDAERLCIDMLEAR